MIVDFIQITKPVRRPRNALRSGAEATRGKLSRRSAVSASVGRQMAKSDGSLGVIGAKNHHPTIPGLQSAPTSPEQTKALLGRILLPALQLAQCLSFQNHAVPKTGIVSPIVVIRPPQPEGATVLAYDLTDVLLSIFGFLMADPLPASVQVRVVTPGCPIRGVVSEARAGRRVQNWVAPDSVVLTPPRMDCTPFELAQKCTGDAPCCCGGIVKGVQVRERG